MKKQILEMVDEKWGEYLEVLTPSERNSRVVEILLNTIISQQSDITYLTRRLDVQTNKSRTAITRMDSLPSQ